MATTSATGLITSLGVGSGIDLNAIVSKLMEVESLPLTDMQQKLSKDNSKISALGNILSQISSLKTAANNLASPVTLKSLVVDSSDATVANATVVPGASAGTYSIHVGNLATTTTLYSSPQTNADTAVGTGSLSIQVGGNAFSVAITSSNNSLTGIANAINGASDNKGVQATVLTDSTGARLVLTGKDTGAANAVTVSASGTLSQLDQSNLTVAQPAQDATLTVNNVPVTSASNTVTSALTGVAIKLTKAGDTTLTVSQDNSAITTAVNNFITSYNKLHDTIKQATAYNTATKSGAILNGNTAVARAMSSLTRQLFVDQTSASGSYKKLSDLGVALQKDGTLALSDSSKLTNAMSTSLADVQSVLTSVGQSFASEAAKLEDNSSFIQSNIDGLNSSVKSLNKSISAFQDRLAIVQANYQKRFNALDSLIASMNQTSSYLTQQLARLP